MKIGVEIPSDKHVVTTFLVLCCVALFFLTSGPNFENIPVSMIFLLGALYALYRSFIVSRHYTINDAGVTAHYWGIYHLYRSWDYFGDVGAYPVYHETEGVMSFIVFSKKKWAKWNRTKWALRFEFFPFSSFYILYSPERLEQIKTYYPKATYCADAAWLKNICAYNYINSGKNAKSS